MCHLDAIFKWTYNKILLFFFLALSEQQQCLGQQSEAPATGVQDRWFPGESHLPAAVVRRWKAEHVQFVEGCAHQIQRQCTELVGR